QLESGFAFGAVPERSGIVPGNDALSVHPFRLLNLHGPADPQLQLRDEAAAAVAELGEEAVVMLKAEKITAARVHFPRRIFEVGQLRDGDDRPATLDQRPAGRAKLKLGDQ